MGVPVVVDDIGASGHDSSLLMVVPCVRNFSCTPFSRSGEERTDGGMLSPPLPEVLEDGDRSESLSPCEIGGQRSATSGMMSGVVVVVVVVVVKVMD